MSTPVLSVRELSVVFPGAARAVDTISFDLEPGEIVGLLGESGCGKSVAALALMGLLPDAAATVTAASIRLAGRELQVSAPAGARGHEIAMVFQEPATALDPVFTVGWQIAAAVRRRRGLARAAAREAALQALADGGFPEPGNVFDAYPVQLSGGMRQLAMIAMAMAVRPSVLIADEPTTALDVTTQALVLDRLLQLRQRLGTAVLLITHDLGVVARCCSRIMVMYCGRIVEQAPYAAFHAHPRHPYSAGLLAAVPRLSDPAGPARPIPGQVPALDQLPDGCHFAPRCPRATPACRSCVPLLPPGGAASAACHHPL